MATTGRAYPDRLQREEKSMLFILIQSHLDFPSNVYEKPPPVHLWIGADACTKDLRGVFMCYIYIFPCEDREPARLPTLQQNKSGV